MQLFCYNFNYSSISINHRQTWKTLSGWGGGGGGGGGGKERGKCKTVCVFTKRRKTEL